MPATQARSTSVHLWRNLALLFAATTISLAILLGRVSDALDTLSATTSTPTVAAFAAHAELGSELAARLGQAPINWTGDEINAFARGLATPPLGTAPDARLIEDLANALAATRPSAP